jgi:hypothetical protein
MALNSAIGKAFHGFAARIHRTFTTFTPSAGFFTAANGAVTMCSNVTTDPVGTGGPSQREAWRPSHDCHPRIAHL